MTLPDPRERPTVSVAEAGSHLGWGRSKSYAAAGNGTLPTIRDGSRVVVPTAALLKMLGVEESSSIRDQRMHDALTAVALEIASAAEDADRVLRRLQDAVAGALAIAGITTSNPGTKPAPNMSDGGPASPPHATDTAGRGRAHDGKPLRVV